MLPPPVDGRKGSEYVWNLILPTQMEPEITLAGVFLLSGDQSNLLLAYETRYVSKPAKTVLL